MVQQRGHKPREHKESKKKQQAEDLPEQMVVDASEKTPDEKEVETVEASEQGAVQTDQTNIAQQKADEYLDLLRRTQADFMNYRRRVTQEQAEERTVAQGALLNQLLPVLDDLERALQAMPVDFVDNPWAQGLQLIERRLKDQLEQLGVKQVGEPGEEFDPRIHEALMTAASADFPEGSVVHVIRPGYTFKDRLIRPAQVSVAGG